MTERQTTVEVAGKASLARIITGRHSPAGVAWNPSSEVRAGVSDRSSKKQQEIRGGHTSAGVAGDASSRLSMKIAESMMSKFFLFCSDKFLRASLLRDEQGRGICSAATSGSPSTRSRWCTTSSSPEEP